MPIVNNVVLHISKFVKSLEHMLKVLNTCTERNSKAKNQNKWTQENLRGLDMCVTLILVIAS